jgi:hypothetical protein
MHSKNWRNSAQINQAMNEMIQISVSNGKLGHRMSDTVINTV